MSRDRLDDSIDLVVSRMVRVDDNDAFAAQIVNALPQRSPRAGWFFQSWAPRLAMIAVVIAAALVWATRESRERIAVAPTLASAPLRVAVEYVAAARTRPLEPLEPVEPVEPLEPLPVRADFDFSLPPIDAVASLEMEAIAPASLPEDAPLTLAPLAIPDLALAADPNSSR